MTFTLFPNKAMRLEPNTRLEWFYQTLLLLLLLLKLLLVLLFTFCVVVVVSHFIYQKVKISKKAIHLSPNEISILKLYMVWDWIFAAVAAIVVVIGLRLFSVIFYDYCGIFQLYWENQNRKQSLCWRSNFFRFVAVLKVSYSNLSIYRKPRVVGRGEHQKATISNTNPS